MVRQAADGGHDRIAWTPGQIQADRYDLSDKIGKIEVTDAIDLSKSGKGSGLIYNDNVRMTKMRDPDGSTVMDLAFNKEGKILQGDGKGKNLSEVVGKELAEKLIKSKGSVNFSGDNLSVGGEGMKSFYDKMMVKTANKFAKKYGQKVEVKSMGKAAKEVWSLKLTPEMKKDILKGGVALSGAGVAATSLIGQEEGYY
jgi:hypothetical protein